MTLVVLLGLLVAGACIGWRTLSAPLAEERRAGHQRPRPACDRGWTRDSSGRATSRSASTTPAAGPGSPARPRRSSTARGFIPGDVGNAPAGLGDVHFVRVLAADRQDPAARLVALQFGQHTLVQAPTATSAPGVDVVVGDDFVGLVKAPEGITARRAGSGC